MQTMSEDQELSKDEINERITELFEKKPDQVSVKSLRDKLDISGDEWRYSYYQYDNGYWKTSVGTEIDLDADGRYNSLLQNELCTWFPACDFVGTIEFAWLVVEKLQSINFDFEIYRQRLSGHWPNDNYHVVFSIAPAFGKITKYSADNAEAPLAICKAAVKAIEARHERE